MGESSYWDTLARRRLSRRSIVGRGAVAGAALALAGCSPQATPAPVAPPAGAPGAAGGSGVAAAPTTGPSAAPAPKYGGVLRGDTNPLSPPHLDPHQTLTATLHTNGAGIAWSRLTKFKTGPGVDPDALTVVGDLAESWEQADDLTYVYKLRPGVKWHNLPPVNGRELEAEDVIFSLQRILDLKVNASYLTGLKGISAVDKRTVKLTVEEPDPDFLALVSDGRNKIVPRDSVSSGGDLKKGPIIGTGPWIFDKFGDSQEHYLVRNPDYFVKGLPYVDRLEFLKPKDYNTIQAAIRAGELHTQNQGVDKSVVDAIRKDRPDIQVFAWTSPFAQSFRLTLNTSRPPLDNLKVRQALSKAMDRRQILDTVYGGGALAPPIPLIDVNAGVPATELDQLYKRDLDGAKRLLGEAGFPNGLSFECLVANYGDDYLAVAELLKAQLRDAGIDLNLKVPPAQEWATATGVTGEFTTEYGPVLQLASVNAWMKGNLKTGGSRNFARLANSQIDALVAQQAGQGRDPAGRSRTISQLQRLLIDQAVILPIGAPTSYNLLQPQVREFRRGAPWARAYEYDYYTYVWFDK
jgi:peptide/nickel transport system substrate-binding protein